MVLCVVPRQRSLSPALDLSTVESLSLNSCGFHICYLNVFACMKPTKNIQKEHVVKK